MLPLTARGVAGERSTSIAEEHASARTLLADAAKVALDDERATQYSSKVLNTPKHHPGKDALFEALAVAAKAISSPRRLELLELLGQAPRTVEGLAEQTAM